jgi:hypothetical protein
VETRWRRGVRAAVKPPENWEAECFLLINETSVEKNMAGEFEAISSIGSGVANAARGADQISSAFSGGSSTSSAGGDPAAQLQAVLDESLRKSLEVQKVQAEHAPAKQAAQIQA